MEQPEKIILDETDYLKDEMSAEVLGNSFSPSIKTHNNNKSRPLDDVKLNDLIRDDLIVNLKEDETICPDHAVEDEGSTPSSNSPCSSSNEEDEDDLDSTKFYENAQTYWSKVPATVDGMLGGFGDISLVDIRGSNGFLQDIFKLKPAPGRKYALDCGAGIGRVTKNLLLPIFDRVDVVEQDTNFANSVNEYVRNSQKLGIVYNKGLQEFQPDHGKYDVMWSQWVLGHLTDEDFVHFFQRCIQGLRKNGIMIIKENVTSSDEINIDRNDSSVTRPLVLLKSLLTQSGLRILKMVRQINFPNGIFPVYMIALRPIKKP